MLPRHWAVNIEKITFNQVFSAQGLTSRAILVGIMKFWPEENTKKIGLFMFLSLTLIL